MANPTMGGGKGALDPVRAELEAAYARAGTAYRQKDAAALMQLVAPGFTQEMPDGQVISAGEAEAALNQWFATTDAVTRYAVQIDSLALQGDEAVADVREEVTTTFSDATGQPRQRVQANTARMTWLRGAAGWQIQRSQYRSAQMTEDGQRVTPLYTEAAP